MANTAARRYSSSSPRGRVCCIHGEIVVIQANNDGSPTRRCWKPSSRSSAKACRNSKFRASKKRRVDVGLTVDSGDDEDVTLARTGFTVRPGRKSPSRSKGRNIRKPQHELDGHVIDVLGPVLEGLCALNEFLGLADDLSEMDSKQFMHCPVA